MNYILVILATLLWGIWAIFEKKLSLTSNVYWLNVYYGFAGITVLPFYLYFAIRFGGKLEFKWSTVGWTYLSLVATLSAGIIFLYLLRRNPAGWVTSFTAAYPLVTLLISALLLKESMSPISIVGAIVVAIGLILMSM